jgi:GxxExxY protein
LDMPYEDEDPPFAEPDKELDLITSAIIGAAIEVHRRLGAGLDEALYHAALKIELTLRGVPFVSEVLVNVDYKGQTIGQRRMISLLRIV